MTFTSKRSFEQRGGDFVVTIFRDWLTADVLSRLGLNERQLLAVFEVKTSGRIGNASYRKLTGTTSKTASRDLEDLVLRGGLARSGRTGRGTHYVLAGKRDINETNRTSLPPLGDPPGGDKKGT